MLLYWTKINSKLWLIANITIIQRVVQSSHMLYVWSWFHWSRFSHMGNLWNLAKFAYLSWNYSWVSSSSASVTEDLRISTSLFKLMLRQEIPSVGAYQYQVIMTLRSANLMRKVDWLSRVIAGSTFSAFCLHFSYILIVFPKRTEELTTTK